MVNLSLIGTAAAEPEAENVILASYTFKAIVGGSYEQGYTIPTKKTDAEYADHSSIDAPAFTLSATIYRSETPIFKALADSMERIVFVCDAGYFDNMMVKNLSTKFGETLNTVVITFNLMQIKVGRTQTVIISLPPAAAVPDTVAKGGSTAKTPATKTVGNAPTGTGTSVIKSDFFQDLLSGLRGAIK